MTFWESYYLPPMEQGPQNLGSREWVNGLLHRRRAYTQNPLEVSVLGHRVSLWNEWVILVF